MSVIIGPVLGQFRPAIERDLEDQTLTPDERAELLAYLNVTKEYGGQVSARLAGPVHPTRGPPLDWELLSYGNLPVGTDAWHTRHAMLYGDNDARSARHVRLGLMNLNENPDETVEWLLQEGHLKALGLLLSERSEMQYRTQNRTETPPPELARAIARSPSLKTVTFRQCRMPTTMLQQILANTRITALKLEYCLLDDQALDLLASTSTLKDLHLRQIYVGNLGFEVLLGSKSITKLHLASNGITRFGALRSNTTLAHLHIDNDLTYRPDLHRNILEDLNALSDNTTIESLGLSSVDVQSQALGVLESTHIKELSLYQLPIDDSNAAIKHLLRMKQLTKLFIWECAITSAALIKLAQRSHLNELQIDDLFNHMPNEIAEFQNALVALAQNQTITRLSLNSITITDPVVHAFSENRTLEFLELSYVSGLTVERLSILARIPTLRTVELDGFPDDNDFEGDFEDDFEEYEDKARKLVETLKQEYALTGRKFVSP